MKFIREYHSKLNELKNCYTKAFETSVNFSESSEIWMPAWTKRSQHIANAEERHQNLKPFIEQWKEQKNSYNSRIQKIIEHSTNEMFAALKKAYLQNTDLHKQIAQEKEIVKNKLQQINKSPHAIACYTINS